MHIDVLSSLLRHVSRSWSLLLGGLGSTTLGVIVFSFSIPVLTLIISFGVNVGLRRRVVNQLQREALRDSIRPTVVSIAAVAVALSALLGFYIVKATYEDHTQLAGAVGKLKLELAASSAILKQKTQNLDSADPAFRNMTAVIGAFMSFRRATGISVPCRVEITAPHDTEAIASTVAALASLGSTCSTVGPLDINGNPDADKKTMTGVIPGIVLLHAARNANGAMALYDSLASILPLKRSYEVPSGQANVVWLQFGTGVEWNSQRLK